VRENLAAGGITMKQALIISQIEEKQEDFLTILLQKEKDDKRKLTDRREASRHRQ